MKKIWAVVIFLSWSSMVQAELCQTLLGSGSLAMKLRPEAQWLSCALYGLDNLRRLSPNVATAGPDLERIGDDFLPRVRSFFPLGHEGLRKLEVIYLLNSINRRLSPDYELRISFNSSSAFRNSSNLQLAPDEFLILTVPSRRNNEQNYVLLLHYNPSTRTARIFDPISGNQNDYLVRELNGQLVLRLEGSEVFANFNGWMIPSSSVSVRVNSDPSGRSDEFELKSLIKGLQSFLRHIKTNADSNFDATFPHLQTENWLKVYRGARGHLNSEEQKMSPQIGALVLELRELFWELDETMAKNRTWQRLLNAKLIDARFLLSETSALDEGEVQNLIPRDLQRKIMRSIEVIDRLAHDFFSPDQIVVNLLLQGLAEYKSLASELASAVSLSDHHCQLALSKLKSSLDRAVNGRRVEALRGRLPDDVAKLDRALAVVSAQRCPVAIDPLHSLRKTI